MRQRAPDLHHTILLSQFQRIGCHSEGMQDSDQENAIYTQLGILKLKTF